MDGEHREHESLVNMRTHLTVLTLAVAQLRRRHGANADIERLCAYAEDAVRNLQADIAEVQATLMQHESREESRQAHFRLRHSLNADRLETGPLPLPAHPPRDP
jgi:hypothetical protein